MEEQNANFGGTEIKKKIVPGALSAMIWGIVSIGTMMYFGWVAAIVGFSKRSKALRLYEENPSIWNEKSLNILRTAKICSTIGLIVSIVTTLLFILYIVFIVSMVSHNYYSPNYY